MEHETLSSKFYSNQKNVDTLDAFESIASFEDFGSLEHLESFEKSRMYRL